MPLGELATRSQQRARALAGRMGLSDGRMELDRVPPSRRVLAPALLDFRATARACRDLDPEAADRVIREAERICNGRFEILGYGHLDFGDPVDWHLDPVHDRRAPDEHFSRIDPLDVEAVGDHKVVWELNRHAFLLPLAQAFGLTGEPRYAARAARLLRSWMDANPPERGINWASSLELGLRSVAWMYVWPVFRDTAAFDRELCRRWLEILDRQALHILRFPSTYFAPNTHLLGEGLALELVGRLFPEFPRAPRYRRTGRRILDEELQRQLLPDGLHYELSACYHRYTTEFLLLRQVAVSLNGLDVPGDGGGYLSHALGAMLPLLGPDGCLVNVGDDDGGQLLRLGARDPLDARPLLASGAIVTGRDDLKGAAGPLPAETVWLLGPEAVDRYDRLAGAPPAPASRVLPEGGYVGLRDGWGENASHLVLDAGEHGPERCRAYHSHDDALSVSVSVAGRTLLTDAGTGSYSDAGTGARLRSRGSHSTAFLEPADLSEVRSNGASPIAQPSTARLVAWGCGDSWSLAEAEGIRNLDAPLPTGQRRRVVGWGNGRWMIWDAFDVHDPHHVVVQFVVAYPPDRIERRGTILLTPAGSLEVVLPDAARRIDEELTAIQISPRYGSFVPASLFRLRFSAPPPVDVVSFVRTEDTPAAYAEGHLRREPRSPDRPSSLPGPVVGGSRGGDLFRLGPLEAREAGDVGDYRTDARVAWLDGAGQGLFLDARLVARDREPVWRREEPGGWALQDGILRPLRTDRRVAGAAVGGTG